MTTDRPPCFASRAALALCLAAAAGGSAKASQQVPDRVQQLEQQVSELKRRLAASEERARAFRGLEFLGDHAPLPAELSHFEVLATTPTPNAKTSDYPDCIVVSLCERLDGNWQRTGEKILVAATVFRNRQLTAASRLTVGMRVRAHLVPFESMPPDVQSIQRVDETDNFELPLLAAIGPTSSGFVKIGAVRAPDGSGPSQADAIANGVRAIETRVQEHGGFEKWQAELEPMRRQLQSRIDAQGGGPLIDGRSLIRNLHYIGHKPNDQWPDPQIAYFTNLRDQLAQLGIDLIVVPFPEREQLSVLEIADNPPEDGVAHPYRDYWHLRLLQAGVEVVDLRPALVEAADHHDFVYYDAVDGHPANGGIVTAAHEIAKRLRRYSDLKPKVQEVAIGSQMYAIPKRHTNFPPHAHEQPCYPAETVHRIDGRQLPRHDPTSPILLIGDSFIGAPRGYDVSGGDIGAHLIKETGVFVRRLEIGGSAAQLMVHLSRRGREFTKGVRVLVYVFRENYMFTHTPDKARNRWQITELPK